MTDSAIYQKIRLQFRAHFGDLKSYVFKDMATEIRKMVVTLRCIAKT